MQIQWSHIAMVGIGGMAGSILRFLVSNWFVQHIPPTFPWGTFTVNLAGCLIIGLVFGFNFKPHQAEIWKLLLASGFCGGFTTFSAFSNEGFQMLRYHLYGLFATYAISSIVLGLLAVAAGYLITRSN
jgi:fluoride exporter